MQMYFISDSLYDFIGSLRQDHKRNIRVHMAFVLNALSKIMLALYKCFFLAIYVADGNSSLFTSSGSWPGAL